jgi:hypothetical protein
MSNTALNYEPLSLSETERQQQTDMIMKLFDLWGLTYKQQAIALGLSPNTETSIYRYKNGKQYLPLFRDMQDRVGHLLAIHKYLRRAYPFNKELAYRWVTTPNADFSNQPPFDAISQDGYMGLIKVRNYLELNQH